MTRKKAAVVSEVKKQSKKHYAVQIAVRNDKGEIEKSFAYPETSTNEKALKQALAMALQEVEGSKIIGLQITGVYSSTKDLIKAIQVK